MTQNRADLYLYDDVIKRGYTLLESNIAQFHNYAKHVEDLRSKLITRNKEYKILKSWFHAAYEDIIKSKFEYGNLTQLYEVLLNNNLVKKFYDYVNDRKTLRLKFIEKIKVSKNLETELNRANEAILSLKTEYNELTQRYEVLLKNNFAEEFLNYVHDQETLRLKLIDTIDECKRLKSCLDSAYEAITMLNSEHDELSRRYQVLLEDNTVKEFLDYAKQQETCRLKSTQTSNDNESSDSCLDRENQIIASLRSELVEARESLCTERLQCEKIKNERDSLHYLSEGLCRLLLKYQRRTLPTEMNKNYSMTDESNQISMNDSKVNVEDNNAPIMVKMEEAYLLPTLTAFVDESLQSSSYPYFMNNDLSEEKYNVAALSLALINENESFVQDQVSTGERESHERIRKPHSRRKASKFPNPPAKSKFQCDKCGKVFYKRSSIVRHMRTTQSCSCREYENGESTTRFDKPSRKCKTSNPRCDICSQYYSSQYSLNRHKQTVHSGIKSYECATCGKRFAQQNHLKQHVLVHGKKKPFKCTTCKQRFNHSSNMITHMRIVHERDARYSCAHCGERFRRKQTLSNHIHLKHFSGILKNFKCTICDKLFASKYHLKIHRSMHT